MSEPIKVSTSKYNKQGKVEVDGHLWTVKLPGAGTELRMSQMEREQRACEARLKNLEKKLDDGTATDEEIDRYEELAKKSHDLTQESYEVFFQSFNDGTPENKSVKKWLDETSPTVIFLTFRDIKEGGDKSNTAKAEEVDGSKDSAASA